MCVLDLRTGTAGNVSWDIELPSDPAAFSGRAEVNERRVFRMAQTGTGDAAADLDDQ